MGYNRARYYDMAAGTWNRLDPFAGNHSDPQSLHKYAYCHGDPVNGMDPDGRERSLTGLLVSMAVGFTIGAISSGVVATTDARAKRLSGSAYAMHIVKAALLGGARSAILAAIIWLFPPASGSLSVGATFGWAVLRFIVVWAYTAISYIAVERMMGRPITETKLYVATLTGALTGGTAMATFMGMECVGCASPEAVDSLMTALLEAGPALFADTVSGLLTTLFSNLTGE